MATLILSAVGTAVGGPIGGAIGAVIGQQADRRLFGPGARRGPRLGDLSVQTSSYGSQIPALFGTMRVAGTVIWSTDLIERRRRQGGGKGRPASVEHHYSASFAVALSSRPIVGVGRIWADGKLLRGAGGDWKSACGALRVHEGREDQPTDPLIAAAEGADAPAYRGIAYVVLEELALADFGNRIPSLTMEVTADEGPVPIAAIAGTLKGGRVAGQGAVRVAGFAASGDSVRSALAALAEIAPLPLIADGDAVRIGRADPAPVTLAAAATGARSGRAGGPTRLDRRAAAMLPREISLTHHDPARDHQAGIQRAVRPGATGRVDARAVAVAVPAAEAKALAEALLADAWAARAEGVVHLPWRALALAPGALLRLPDTPGLWRVRERTLEAMVVSLSIEQAAAPRVAPGTASAGRATRETDLPHGPTHVHLLDLPTGGEGADGIRLWAACAGPSAGWRRAVLELSLDGGATRRAAGTSAAPATMGIVTVPPGPGGSALFDTLSAIEVALLNESMWLEGRSDAALAAGDNLALVGDEIVQFGAATPLGAGRFRLTRLLRGRRGTEWAAAGHAPDERFVMLDADALAPVDVAAETTGSTAILWASGIGDAVPAEATCAVRGEARHPPSPVHATSSAAPGGMLIRWTRRSRAGWQWTDHADTSLGEERERYRLVIAGTGFTRSIEVEAPWFLYTDAIRAADGAAGPATATIAQLGTHGASRPAILPLHL